MGLRTWLANRWQDDGDERPDFRTTALVEVEWYEEEHTYDRVTRRLCWPGGFELEITYVERPHMAHYRDWIAAAEDYDGRIISEPAYTEVVHREEDAVIGTEGERRTAWMRRPQDGVEPTGNRRVIHIVEEESYAVE